MNVCFYIKSQGGYIRARDIKDNRPMYDQLLSEVAKGNALPPLWQLITTVMVNCCHNGGKKAKANCSDFAKKY